MKKILMLLCFVLIIVGCSNAKQEIESESLDLEEVSEVGIGDINGNISELDIDKVAVIDKPKEESKSTETKQENKPVANSSTTKPSTTKPNTSASKPAESKPVETKPVENKPSESPKEPVKESPKYEKDKPVDPNKPYESLFYKNLGTTDKCIIYSNSDEPYKYPEWTSIFCDNYGNLFYDLEKPSEGPKLSFPGYDANLTIEEIQTKMGAMKTDNIYRVGKTKAEAENLMWNFMENYTDDQGRFYTDVFHGGIVAETRTNDGQVRWIAIFTKK